MNPIIIIAIAVVLLIPLSISAQSQYDIPSWVKTNAVWWGEGQISDSEFISSLQFLINSGILKVTSSDSKDIVELEKKIQFLEAEDKRLRTVIDNIHLREKAQEKYEEETIDTSQLTVSELKQQSVDWNYDDILRNEEYYLGKIIHLTGEISAIEKYSGEDSEYEHWLLLSVDTGDSSFGDGYFGDSIYVWYDGSRLLMGDTVEVYLIVDDVVEKEFLKGYPSYYPLGTARYVTCTNC